MKLEIGRGGGPHAIGTTEASSIRFPCVNVPRFDRKVSWCTAFVRRHRLRKLTRTRTRPVSKTMSSYWTRSKNSAVPKSIEKLFTRVRLGYKGDGIQVREKAAQMVICLAARNNDGERGIDRTDFPDEVFAVSVGQTQVNDHGIDAARNKLQFAQCPSEDFLIL
jgi:hypothetical protein